MVFYPDNVPRASRVQQLIDTMGIMQSDIKNFANQMDQKNAQIAPLVENLLRQKGYLSLDDLINKSLEQLSPEDKKTCEAVINAAKMAEFGIDVTHNIGAILLLPETHIMANKLVMAAGQLALKLKSTKLLARFFKSAEGGTNAAAEAANEVQEAANEAKNDIEEVAAAEQAETEVEETVSLLGRLSTLFEFLGVVGFSLSLVTTTLEVVEGAEQKRRLVEAIHSLQPARLSIAYFRQEATATLQIYETIYQWLNASCGPRANPAVAAWLGDGIATTISNNTNAINWAGLESDLETQDKQSSNYYGSDDLPSGQVIAAAQASNK